MPMRKWAAMAASFLFVIAVMRGYGPAAVYVETVKAMAGPAAMAEAGAGNASVGGRGQGDPLLEEIRRAAAERRIPPVDARVDPVWKAIPGLNGLEVDIDATYRMALASPLREPIRYVYREIPPRIELQALGPRPVYRGNPGKPAASFMINVAWGNAYIGPMLDILDREKVKATFFLDGSWLENNPELARTIAARGHEMSNHAYSHPAMSKLDKEAQRRQIEKTEELLKSVLGVRNRWFAPPSGDYNQTTVETAAELGLITVLWTVDTVDWRKPAPSAVVAKIARESGPGSLILMHPTASSQAALPGMIRELKRKGLTLGTVSETLSARRLPSVEGEAQF